MQQITVEVTAPARTPGHVGEHEWQNLEVEVMNAAAAMGLPMQIGPFERKLSLPMDRWDPATLCVSALFR